MILPKGIVLNTDRVYKEVANYPTVPPEKIYEYWHGIKITVTPFGFLTKLIQAQSILQPLTG
jgi:hypothetical protein